MAFFIQPLYIGIFPKLDRHNESELSDLIGGLNMRLYKRFAGSKFPAKGVLLIVLATILLNIHSCQKKKSFAYKDFFATVNKAYQDSLKKNNNPDPYWQYQLKSRVLMTQLLDHYPMLDPTHADDSLVFYTTKSDNGKTYFYSRYIGDPIVLPFVMIAEKQGDRFKELYFSIKDEAFLNDTLKDINGDHQLEYVVNWYPAAGRYKGEMTDVYALDANDGAIKKFTLDMPEYLLGAKNKVITHYQSLDDQFWHLIVLGKKLELDTLQSYRHTSDTLFFYDHTTGKTEIVSELPEDFGISLED